MSQTVLIDLPPHVLERVQRLGTAYGWALQPTLMHLLEHGLFTCEADNAARFTEDDASALQAAISALRDIPDDPGFSMIGRVSA